MNNAFIGRDIYIRCPDVHSITEWALITELDYPSLDLKNAIYGGDGGVRGTSSSSSSHLLSAQSGEDEEIEPDPTEFDLITFFYNFTPALIYANTNTFSTSSENTANCGTSRLPCASLSYAASHVDHSPDSNLLFAEGTSLEGELPVTRFTLRPYQESGMFVIRVSSTEQRRRATQAGFITAKEAGSIERISFEITTNR